eukprot:m.29360 g.29360  ORF g.29360 m.29360 type:complete len:458 (+) comp4587_c0_seq1:146-1519(+)
MTGPTPKMSTPPTASTTATKSESAAALMRGFPEKEIPENVKFYQTRRNPNVGERTVLIKSAPIPTDAVYGVKTQVNLSESAGSLINPPPPSKFEQALANAKHPTLKADRLADELKAKLVASGEAFGEPSDHGGTAAECVNPSVPPEQIEADEQARVTLYRKTHGAYGPGEQVNRGYKGHFEPNAVCGVPTPQDTRGGGVAKTMKWSSPKQPTAIVSATRRKHSDGPEKPAAVQDPNTVFGIVTRPMGDTVDGLIRTAGPAEDDSALRDRVRSILTPDSVAHLNVLEDNFAAADESESGTVPDAVARELCTTHLPELGPRAVQELLDASAGSDADTIDWTVLMDIVRPPPMASSAEMRPCGTSTIRTDLPAPSFVSVTETRNFGDQGGAGRVINPSLFTTRGVTDRAVVNGKEKEELRLIFETAGLQEDNDFEAVWEKATQLAQSDLVSIETFQQALM